MRSRAAAVAGARRLPLPAAEEAVVRDGGDGAAESAGTSPAAKRVLGAKRPRRGGEAAPQPQPREPLPAAVPSVRLVAHASSPLDGCGRARVLTAQPVLPVSASEVAAIERLACAHSVRPANEGEPPLYSWVRQLNNRKQELTPCWAKDASLAAAVRRLLDLCHRVAEEGARALGIKLLHHFPATIVNVWNPGARAETVHDDGPNMLTVLLRLRAVPGSAVLMFAESEEADVWHAALGDADTLLVFGPHVRHLVTRPTAEATEARITLVALYPTQKPKGEAPSTDAASKGNRTDPPSKR